MTQISAPQSYTFENETVVYSIDANSEKGTDFRALSNGSEKVDFLKENGKAMTKETGGRIMLPQRGAWRFCNVGQLEYMFRADDDASADSESPLERQIKDIESTEDKKAFFFKNATRIREWPERIQRTENLA